MANVEDFGAIGDGVIDDTAAIQNALNSVGYGGEVLLSARRYKISGLTIPQYVTLRGTWNSPGYNGLANAESFNDMRSVLLLDPAGTISMKQATTLANLVVYNNSVATGSVPVNGSSSFAGTAITMGGLVDFQNTPIQSPDMLVDNVMLLGFNLGINALRCINSKIRHVNLDCNNGILADTGGNPIDIQWVLGWPFLSVGFNPYSDAAILRPGFGIKLQNNMDATRIQFCTFFNFNRAFYLLKTNGITLIGCGADAPQDQYSNGLLIEGACGITQALGCQFVANAVGIVMNCASDTDTLLLSNTYFVANRNYDIDILKGSLQVGGQCHFGSDVTNSIHVVQSTGLVSVSDCVVTKSNGVVVLSATSDNVYLNSGIVTSSSKVQALNATSLKLPELIAENSVVLPTSRSAFNIAGNTNIFGFTNGWPGRIVTLTFSSNVVLTDSGAGNLNLAGNFTAAPGSCITLMALSATSWTEVSRSNN